MVVPTSHGLAVVGADKKNQIKALILVCIRCGPGMIFTYGHLVGF